MASARRRGQGVVMGVWIDEHGALYHGDSRLNAARGEFDRAATAAEISDWETERAANAAPQTISWVDFVALFTPGEFGAIAVSNDPGVAAFRLLASGLGGDLNFADPRVAQGVDALIAAGIVAAGRRAAILSRTPA